MTLSTLETLRLTIAAIKQHTGESQRQLATALDLTQDKISRRQSGAQPWSLDEIDALARHWGMRPLDLLAGPTHAAQHLTWPPDTTAPAPQPDTAPVPTTFAAPTPVPTPTATPAPRPNPPRRETPRRPTEPYTPLTPIPDGWIRPGERATVPDEQQPLLAADAAPATEQQAAAPVAAPVPVAPIASAAPEAAPTAPPAPAAPTFPAVSEASPTELPAEQQPTAWATPVAATAVQGEELLVDPAPAAGASADYDRGPDGEILTHPATPCEQCERPITHRIRGRALHPGGWCTPASAAPPATAPAQAAPTPAPAGPTTTTDQTPLVPSDQNTPTTSAAPTTMPTPARTAPIPATPTQTADIANQDTQPTPARTNSPSATPDPVTTSAPSAKFREYASTGRELGYYLDTITSAVEQALEEHDGDIEAASATLEKKAIPNGMALFDATRVGAAYEHTAYPERLEFLSKKSRNGADEIWEGRHKWENTPLTASLKAGADPVTVDVLDTNAAYCSALKTHLPIGALQHRPDGGWDPKRSGIYLLPARPVWEHPHLPDPIGNRHEAGPVLLDEATMRLLIRCHKLGLADAPHITEAWTSGATEGMLEKFRRILTIARENAIRDGDQVTEKYIKAIYAKFASTIGESTYNRDIRRPDWMHIIRSQAFANLWYKSQRAHKAGLTIVALRGTDELHVTGGEWRKANGGVFEEGRLTTQLKLKDQYTLPRTRTRST
ncbi:hypothetical protein [Kitasatospora sp. NPDC087271]|uniref:hypothetical protein n=1 Tax=Kitasatospora sp. NPDC087271 TaxID=3364067 RepID=UPI00380AB73E